MSKTTFIYALCEPGTRTVRYIGKTVDIKRRFREHLKESVKLPTHLGCWLQHVVRAGQTPNLVVLSKVLGRAWKAEERLYIANARMLGMDLVNLSDGGEGVTQTPEVRKKIGDANRGKPCSLEQRKQISKTLTGRKLPKAHRRAIGNGVRGTVHTPKACRAMQLAKLGRKNPYFGKVGPAHHAFGTKKKNSTSKFPGVSLYIGETGWTRWVAQVSGKRLGYFKLEIDAYKAYTKAVEKLYGPEATTNFPVKCRGQKTN